MKAEAGGSCFESAAFDHRAEGRTASVRKRKMSVLGRRGVMRPRAPVRMEVDSRCPQTLIPARSLGAPGNVWNGGDLDTRGRTRGRRVPKLRSTFGKARTRAILTAWRTAFPDLTFVVGEEIVYEDRVAHRVTVRGTYLGTFKLLGWNQ